MIRKALIGALALSALHTIPANAATFLFVRHAESLANAGVATTVEEYIDPTLTATGEAQAEALIETLKDENIIAIYTSAYQRTQLTIDPTADYLGMTYTIDARTNEWYFGDLDSLADMASIDVYSMMGEWAAGNYDANSGLPNGELLTDMIARVIPAWQEIIDAYADIDGTVVLVGHGAEMGYVMPFFAENVSLDFAFANGLQNTGIIEVEVVDGAAYVTNWQGTEFDIASVPVPASGLLLIGGVAALAVRKKLRRAA